VSRPGSSISARGRSEGSGETGSDYGCGEKAIMMLTTAAITGITIITAVLIFKYLHGLKPVRIFKKRK